MSVQEEIKEQLVMEPETPGESMPYHARIRFPETFSAFQGHFPGNPVLPGIALVALAQCFLERALGVKTVLSSLKRTKFFQMVSPETELLLAGNARLSGEIVSAEVRISDASGKRVSALSLELTKEVM